MSAVDQDAWTCPIPDCGETVRGGKKALNFAQGVHARRHQLERAEIRELARVKAAPLDVPPPPKIRARRR